MAQEVQPKPPTELTAASAAAVAAIMGEKIHILGKTEACPLIDGHNLFTGDFNRINTTVNLVVSNQWEWEQAWTVIGIRPPGALPPDTRAVFEAVKKAMNDTTISFRPEKIEATGENLLVDWLRSNVAPDEDMNAKASYSVLLLPKKGELKAQFNDVWPVREKRKLDAKLEESYKIFKKGSTAPIQAPPQAAFRKRKMNNRGRN